MTRAKQKIKDFNGYKIKGREMITDMIKSNKKNKKQKKNWSEDSQIDLSN